MFQFKANRAAVILFLAAPAALIASAPALAIVPGSSAAVNVDKAGLALRGYDPVAYFDSGKPTAGKAAISASFDGSRYLFASEDHRATFLADPAKYVPQFGGFCALGTSYGEKVDGDPNTGRVVADKLYVNNSPRAAELFNEDVSGTIERAEQNWPTVKDKVAE